MGGKEVRPDIRGALKREKPWALDGSNGAKRATRATTTTQARASQKPVSKLGPNQALPPCRDPGTAATRPAMASTQRGSPGVLVERDGPDHHEGHTGGNQQARLRVRRGAGAKGWFRRFRSGAPVGGPQS